MTLEEAKREFQIRSYYWYVSEFEKEIRESFPKLRLFKSGYGWQMHIFMQKLEPRDQLILAHARCKRGSVYLEASGEKMTSEETELLDRFEQFVREPTWMETEIRLRKDAGEKIKLIAKSKLRKAAVAKFVEAFGSQCFDMKLGAERDPQFHMKICGWIVFTQLAFGRSQAVLTYRHSVVSETRIAHPQNPQITGPAMTLSPGFAWLVNQWEDILEEDVDATCNALVKHADCFFSAAPQLLAGLQFDKVK